MKHLNVLIRPKLFLAFLVMFLSFSGDAFAQHIYLTWTSEVGCQEYSTGGRKDFLEDIHGDESCILVSENGAVNYTIGGDTANIQSVQWYASGGTLTPVGLSCQIYWGFVGFGNVAALITFNDGTTRYGSFCVEKIQGPSALFGVMPDVTSLHYQGCIEQPISFTNLSTTNGGPGLISYYWDFGDGHTSSEFEPTYTYTQPGYYMVLLMVTNSCNVESYYGMVVEVLKEGIEISCPGVICEGQKARYSVPKHIFQRCSEPHWIADGGTIVGPNNSYEVEVVWDHVGDDGFGYLTFDGSSCRIGCASVITIKIPVVLSKGTIVGETSVCEKRQYRYKLPQWPTTEYDWKIMNPADTGASLIQTDQWNEVIVNTNSSGTIYLKCEYFNTLLHCGGVATLTLHVQSETEITGPLLMCNGALGTYDLTSAGNPVSGAWTLEVPGGSIISGTGSSFTHTFTVPGNYMLYVADDPAYCRPEPLTITIGATPNAPGPITGPAQMCPNTPLTYSITNTVPGTTIGWQVQNGTINGSDYGDEISVTFGNTGPYSVTAWREDIAAPNCRSGNATFNVVKINPTLVITPEFPTTPLCGSSNMNYSVNYTDGNTYVWTISPASAGSVVSGDGTSGISVLWNQPTVPMITAQVNVSIYKCNGTPFTSSLNVNIINTPQITISTPNSQICKGESATFSLSPAVSGTVTWDFGDGVTSGSPTHTYNQPIQASSTYTVTATVTSPNGCPIPATASFIMTVIPAPEASITPSNTVIACDITDLSGYILYANIQSGFGNTTGIEWHHIVLGVDTVLSLPAMTSSIDVGDYDFGQFYAIVTNEYFCTDRTNTVTVLQQCPTTGCQIVPDPQLGDLTAILTGCNTIEVSANYAIAPISHSWQYVDGTGVSSVNHLTLTTANTGVNTIQYFATYMGTNNELCILERRIDVIVPYQADIKYDITCGSNGKYNVKLIDHSVYHPGSEIDTYTFYVNGVAQTGNPIPTEIELELLPSVTPYVFGLSIAGDTNPVCTDSETVLLPAMPSAEFTPTNATVCQGESLHFTASDTTPGLTYEWNFTNGAFNLQQNPDRVFEAGGTIPVTLIVRNSYGCEATVTHNVTVNSKTLSGSLTPLEGKACEGSTVTLSYVPDALTPTPTGYQWMSGSSAIPGATNPTLAVTTQGSYWLVATNAAGCASDFNRPNANVSFIKPPVAAIEGPGGVCAGGTVILSGKASGTGITYKWWLNGFLQPQWNGLSEIAATLNSPGANTYTLEVCIPNGSGGFCCSTDTHVVTAYELPNEPSLNFDIDCENYNVTISVSPVEPGLYTWSNGMTGPVITVTEGGPYQVRYTNSGGCSVTSEIDVPKNPENYLWIFPAGCYSLCKSFENATLIGPLPEFYKWAWLLNGNSDVQGGGHVPDYDIHSAGDHQLYLANKYCGATSDVMSVTEISDCHGCKIEAGLKKDIKINDKDKYNCYYELYLSIYNSTTYTMYVTISSPDGMGVFVPSVVVVPPGATTSFLVEMYPINGFNGGPLTLYFESVDSKGVPCKYKKEFNFPAGCKGQSGEPQMNKSEEAKSNTVSGLQIVPNPANQETQLLYMYANDASGNERSIEIYDLLGRMVAKIVPGETKGSVTLPLNGYPSGYYIVALKENGQVLQHQKLIVK